jgi:hypothetical protein
MSEQMVWIVGPRGQAPHAIFDNEPGAHAWKNRPDAGEDEVVIRYVLVSDSDGADLAMTDDFGGTLLSLRPDEEP